MKILLVITGMTMGGAEKVVADLADAFVGAGDEVLLVYLKGPMEVRPRRPEVDKMCLGMDSFRGVLGGAAKFRKLLRDDLDDRFLGLAVHIGDKIYRALIIDLNLLREVLLYNSARRARGFDRDCFVVFAHEGLVNIAYYNTV